MQLRKLKIGIILSHFPFYTETFFLNQVIGLCKNGHDVIVFCSTISRDKKFFDLYQLDSYKNLQVVRFDYKTLLFSFLRSFGNPRYLAFQERAGLRKSVVDNFYLFYFLKYECDIYHFGYSAVALTFEGILDRIPGKKVISCLGTAENVKPVTELNRETKLKSVLGKADAIHAVTKDMKRVITELGIEQAKIFVNHPAIDTDYFASHSNLDPIVSTKDIVILSIGRLVFQKGLILGLFAVKKLAERFKNFKWIIAGEGPDHEELLFNVHLLGLTNHVLLAGKKTKDEIYLLYQDSDIFFLPSITEGMANVVLEAMSMQLPVVSSDCGGMSEIITHRSNGLLCKNYDYEGMATSLLELCKEPEKRKSLGVEARKTVVEDFNIERYIHVFEEAYLRMF